MPIHYQQQQQQTQFLVWEQLESIHFFQQALALSPQQQEELNAKYRHAPARLDWLASRYALQRLCGQHCSSFYKDAAGKLRVPNDPFYYSISHSGIYVAAIQAATTVGVDVQIPNAKLARIAHKYIAPNVLTMIKQPAAHYQDYLHYYWGIKEALFKAYGQGQVNFIDHLHVLPFFPHSEGHTLARLQKPKEEAWYKIFYKKTANYYLCVAIAL
ncbi:MAG: 4'-phosphopantetheinyl transferase family protein [Aureispira sp.]